MKEGIYTYKVPLGQYPAQTFNIINMKVFILDESPKSYLIKFREFHADGRPPGTTSRVMRKSVKPIAIPSNPELPFNG